MIVVGCVFWLVDFPGMILLEFVSKRVQFSPDVGLIYVFGLCTVLYAGLGWWVGKVLAEPEHNRRRTWR